MIHVENSSSQRKPSLTLFFSPTGLLVLVMVGWDGISGFVKLVWVEPVKTMDAGHSFQPRRDLWRWLLFPSQNLGDKSLRNTSAGGNFYLGHVHERRI